jgi:prepilin-type N-terminal cleavage/methylation domain-containing protein
MNADYRMRIAECRARKSQGGFSLIEIIITLAVLSIAAVAVLSVFTIGIKGSPNPLFAAQATQLAQGEIDQVLGEKAANGFASIAIGNGLACNSVVLAGFNCSRNVYFVNAGALNTQVGGPTNYRHVTVTITQATVGSVTMDTVVTNY